MMNRYLSAILILALSGFSLNTLADDDGDSDERNDQKVVLCHKGKNSIAVGAPGLAAHLGHNDTEGPCVKDDDEDSDDEWEDQDKRAAVVVMSCSGEPGPGVKVVSFSSSVEFTDQTLISIGPDSDCAHTLAALINGGFNLRSVNGTDYLLLGKVR